MRIKLIMIITAILLISNIPILLRAQEVLLWEYVWDKNDPASKLTLTFDLPESEAPYYCYVDRNIYIDSTDRGTSPLDDKDVFIKLENSPFVINLDRYDNPGIYTARIWILNRNKVKVYDKKIILINYQPYFAGPILAVHGIGGDHYTFVEESAHFIFQWLRGEWVPEQGNDQFYDGELIYRGGYDLVCVASTMNHSSWPHLFYDWKELVDPEIWNDEPQDGFFTDPIPEYTDEFGVHYDAYEWTGPKSRWFPLAIDRWQYCFKKKFHHDPSYYFGPDYIPKVTLLAVSLGGVISRGFLQSDLYGKPYRVRRFVDIATPHLGVGLAALANFRNLGPIDDSYPFTDGYPSPVVNFFKNLLTEGELGDGIPLHIHFDNAELNWVNLWFYIPLPDDFWDQIGYDPEDVKNPVITDLNPYSQYVYDLNNPDTGKFGKIPDEIEVALCASRLYMTEDYYNYVLPTLIKTYVDLYVNLDFDPGFYPYYKDIGQTIEYWQTSSGDFEPEDTVGYYLRNWIMNYLYRELAPPDNKNITVIDVILKEQQLRITLPFQPTPDFPRYDYTIVISLWLPKPIWGEGDFLIPYNSAFAIGSKALPEHVEYYDIIQIHHGNDLGAHRNKLTYLKAIEGPSKIYVIDKGIETKLDNNDKNITIFDGILNGKISDYLLHCLYNPEPYIYYQFYNTKPPFVHREGDATIEDIKRPDYNQNPWPDYNEWLGPHDMYADLRFDGYTIPEWFDGTARWRQDYLFIAKNFVNAYENTGSVIHYKVNDNDWQPLFITDSGYFSIDLSQYFSNTNQIEVSIKVVNPAGIETVRNFTLTNYNSDSISNLKIVSAGFWNSFIKNGDKNLLNIKAVISGNPNLVDNVQLYYKNTPLGIYLLDDGKGADEIAGDNIFSASIELNGQLPIGKFLFNIVLTDIFGNKSSWPSLTVSD